MSDIWKAALGRTGECPDVEALAARELSPETKQHLESCLRCRTELATLREFEAMDVRPAEMESVQWIGGELQRRSSEIFVEAAPPVAVPPAPRRLFPAWRILAMGALALVLVAVGLYWRSGTTQPLPVSSEAPVWRSGQIALLEPLGDVTAPPREFRWEAVAGAASYRLHLQEVDGIEIWTADSVEAKIAASAGIAAKLTPGRAFQWNVEARNAAGEKLATGSLQSFHILVTTH
jgi:hypothetical protein